MIKYIFITGGDAFSQGRDNAAGNEYVLDHGRRLYRKTGNPSKEEARDTKPPQVNTRLKKPDIVNVFQ
jgi:hypothetical protein